MPENSIPHTLNAFLTDLVEIRELFGITLDDIRARTKVYPHIIAQFEEDGLSEHPLFNQLYLKAFARSYAKVVGISPELVADAYEAALNGKYRRELAIEYLGLEIEHIENFVSSKERVTQVVEEETHTIESAPALPDQDTTAAAKKVAEPKQRISQVKNEREVSFMEQIAALDLYGKLRSWWVSALGDSSNRGIVQWGVLAACIAAGAYLLFQLINIPNSDISTDLAGEPGSSFQEASVTEEDSTLNAAELVDPTEIERKERIQSVLDQMNAQDSLQVFVVAEGGKLDPFRSKVDNDLRRPYWLNEGDSMSFWFAEEIVLEDNLASMRILYERIDFPIYQTDSTARVVITRDSISSILNAQLN